MMTSSKAIAGGVGTNVGIVVAWALTKIPGWATVPESVQHAIFALVIGSVGYLIVYHAPANRLTVDAPEPQP